jgi:hypothetical protein
MSSKARKSSHDRKASLLISAQYKRATPACSQTQPPRHPVDEDCRSQDTILSPCVKQLETAESSPVRSLTPASVNCGMIDEAVE